MAAEVGHLDLAYDYLGEAARLDLDDLEGNTGDGIHIASVAGTWLAAVCGLGGLRDHGGRLTFAPRLPGPITHLMFRLGYRGRGVQVDVDQDNVTYTLLYGEALEFGHHGDQVTVKPDEPLVVAIPKIKRRRPPRQPRGRAPVRRQPLR
jgi:alpha,alpha-trehalose phosphorylase